VSRFSNRNHHLEISGRQKPAQALEETPTIDGAKGLGAIGVVGDGADSMTSLGARRHPSQESKGDARQIDGHEEIQV
jgi:hypothetical protein